MRLALDANRYSDFTRGEREVVQKIQNAALVVLPFIVLGELRAGFAGGTRGRANEAVLTRILSLPTVEVLYADQETTHHYAAISVQLRQQGTPIPSNDLWIAALVIQHDLVLFSRDRHFEHLPQIARI